VQFPAASSTPSSAVSEVRRLERFGVLPRDEGLSLPFPGDSHLAHVHGEGVALVVVAELIRGLHLHHGILVVLPERTELVLPAPQKQFQHGAVLIRPLRETDMSVVLAAHAEGHLVAVERLEVILKLVLRLEFDILGELEGPRGAVACGVAEVAPTELFGKGRAHEGELVLSSFADLHILVGEGDPEFPHFVSAQNFGSSLLGQVVPFVIADSGVLALPSPDENLQNVVRFAVTGREAHVAIVRSLHPESDGLATERQELVVLLIAGFVDWQILHCEFFF